MNVSARKEEISFVIDICSYNNSQWYKNNLDSVFNQNYSNYRIIYTDDCSDDQTGDLVKAYIKERGMEDKVTVICNHQRRRQLANHWRTAQLCDDEEVIVVLDGDDWFTGQTLLQRLNDIYKRGNIWMTYGQYKNWPTNDRGYCHATNPAIITENAFREHFWFWGHTRTYYAWLAKLVKLQDLIISEIKQEEDLEGFVGPTVTPFMIKEAQKYQGRFFPASADTALGYPMVEMAGKHIKYIPKIHYLRNVANTINTFKTQGQVQRYSARYVCSKDRYAPLITPVKKQKKIDSLSKIDVLVFCKDEKTVSSFSHFYQQLYKRFHKIRDVHLLVDECSEDLIVSLKNRFPYLIIHSVKNNLADSFEELDSRGLTDCILCMRGDEQLSRNIDLAFSAQILEKTHAHAFYLAEKSDKNIPLFDWLGIENIYFWQLRFDNESHFWQHPFSFSQTLYPKSELKDVIKRSLFKSIKDIDENKLNSLIDKSKIGLFYR